MNVGRYTSLQEFISAEAALLERKQLPRTPLVYVLQNHCITVDGLWMEFGVHTGDTINVIAMHTENAVYGFDSFEGLPEDWRQGKPNGRYSTDGNLPDVKHNVELISGLFEKTLPQFLEQHPENTALIHIDCDLYSSTKTVLTLLKKRIVEGTVIVFDELFNYPEYEKHEIKAFYEFLKESNVRFEWIGVQGKISLVPDHIDEEQYYARYSGAGLRVVKAA